MANIKINDLGAIADPVSDDVLPIVDVSADVTNKISIAELLQNASSGAAVAPGIAFDGDGDTGISNPNPDELAFSTGGTGRLFIDSNGRVGIGVTPAATLHVKANSVQAQFESTNGVGTIFFKENNNTTMSIISATSGVNSIQSGSLAFKNLTATSEYLRIDSSGRLLVGTSSSASNNSVVIEGYSGSNTGQGILTLAKGSSTPADGNVLGAVEFTDSGHVASASVIGRRDGGTWTSGSSQPSRLVFSTTADSASTPTERMRITSDGQLRSGPEVFTDRTSHLTQLSSSDENVLSLQQPVNTVGSKTSLSFYHRNSNNAAVIYGKINTELKQNNAGNHIGDLVFSTVTGGSLDEQLRITGDGNVGIGTTSPSTTLNVVKSSSGGTTIQFTDSANATGRLGTPSASLVAFGGNTDHNIVFGGWANDGNSFVNERVRIDSSGRLLVGTSSAPSTGSWAQYSKLTVKGYVGGDGETGIINISRGEAATSIVSGEDIGVLSFSDTTGNEFAWIRCSADANAGSGDYPGRLTFFTTADNASSPTERVRIDSSGNLLIGGTYTTWFSNYAGAIYGKGGAPRLVLGRTDASDATQRTCAVFTNSSNSFVGSIDVTSTSTVFATSSDHRLKENVVPLTGAADRVNQLQVRRFNFIADPDTTVDGFIAHEAQDVVPECVTGTKDAVDDEGNPVYQGIDQSKLVPLLTAALQEAIAKIETLEQRLTDAGL